MLKTLFPDYVSLENPDHRSFAKEDPNGFLQQYANKTILDEVQRVPELFSYLQTAVDQSGQMGQYILSGSQNFHLLKHITQSLAGRVALFRLLVFFYISLHKLKYDVTEGKFDVNIELVEGLDVSAGYEFNERVKLSYALEMNGQVALLEKDGKDVIFSHQYIVTGFRPEIKLGKTGLSMTGMAGLNLYRPASYSDRTLKGVFAGDNDYYFSVSPYASVGIKMKF